MIGDEELLRLARKGQEEAFAQLYGRYRGPLYAFAFRLTGSETEAEDLVHDSMIGILRQQSGFDPERGALRAYLYAAVRNQARKRYRDGRLEETDDSPDEPADGETPLAILLTAETARQVQQAVAALPELQREVLLLAEYEELQLAEIASIVDADLGTVKSRLHRARQALKRALRPSATPARG